MGAVLLYDEDALRRALQLRVPASRRRWPDVRLAFHEGLPGSVFVSGQGRFARASPADYGTHAARVRATRPRARTAGARLCVPDRAARPQKLGVLLLESVDLARRVRARRPALRGARWPTRRPSPSATRCTCAGSWSWTASARSYLSNVSHELRTPAHGDPGLPGGARPATPADRAAAAVPERRAASRLPASRPADRRDPGGLAAGAGRGPAPPRVGAGARSTSSCARWCSACGRRPR